jgi:tetratricopeptide (TPR) repeat protein
MPPLATRDDSPAWRAIASRLEAPDANDLLEINLAVARAIDPSVNLTATRASLDAMTLALRQTLPRRCNVRCRIAALNRYLFVTRRFRAIKDPDQLYDDVRNDLIPHVVARGEGYCVGLSHLYLTLALRLGLDATIVPLRRHEFVRITDTHGVVIDVDPTRGGAPPVAVDACVGAAPVFGRGLSMRAIAARTIALIGLARGVAARPWLDAAARLDDSDPDLFNNRGMLRLRHNDVEGALADFRRATSLDPCTDIYGVNEVSVLWTLGKKAEARARLDAVAATGEATMVVEIRRALMAYDDERDTEADAIFTAAIRRWMGAPSILQARAAVRLAQGRTVDALRDTRAAAALDDDAEAHASVVIAALEAGDLSVARGALTALEARAPTAGNIDLQRALVAAAHGHYNVAGELARRCLERHQRRCVRAMLVLADVARAHHDEACAQRFAEAYLSCPRAPNDRRQQIFDARTRARYLR